MPLTFAAFDHLRVSAHSRDSDSVLPKDLKESGSEGSLCRFSHRHLRHRRAGRRKMKDIET